MNTNRLLAFQAFAQFLQIVNAQIGVITHSASLAVIIGAAVASFSFYVQHVGNQTPPTIKGS